MNEAKVLARISHPNIVKLHKVYDSTKCFILLMEAANGGSLKGFMKYRKLKKILLKDAECALIVKQILEGLAYIHSLGIMHRDLKLENVLMATFARVNGSVKIADFGFGAKAQSFGREETRGTIFYMAPEILTQEKYTKV